MQRTPSVRVRLAKRELPHIGLSLALALYRGSFTSFAAPTLTDWRVYAGLRPDPFKASP
ncbi:MAG: hypothetical protein QM523_11435 [Candidatus Pacebacteria bacterium]|nr:hypothetical protein [Candidatus Paceibacterota bacterium]